MMNMVSKSTSILMAIGIVAVAAVAIIGLGYAYTATTDNTDNTSAVTYITLSQSDYDGVFNGAVKYNTVTTSTGTTKTFDTEQLQTIFDSTKAISLGTASFTVAQTGTASDYNFSVQKTAGTMTGTFYIKTTIGGVSTIRLFDSSATNYYSSAAGHDAVTSAPGSLAVDDAVTSITVEMFVAAMPDPTANAEVVKPLNGVTFQFKAIVPETA